MAQNNLMDANAGASADWLPDQCPKREERRGHAFVRGTCLFCGKTRDDVKRRC